MKIDPYRSEATYRRWKERVAGGIPGLSAENSRVILRFLRDFEVGRNVARVSGKGARGYLRLNTLRQKLCFLARAFEERFGLFDLALVSEQQLHEFFADMRSGAIQKQRGGRYRSTGDYVKVFKAFWHWHMRAQRKAGVIVEDRCLDLDDRSAKPPWVYLTAEQVRQLAQAATYKYRVLLMFLLDSGIRSPTELVNVRRRDLSEDCRHLHIREETSKTFGRRINLLLSPDLLRGYLRQTPLGPDESVFPICPSVANRYFRRLATRVLGTGQSRGGKPFSQLRLYDLRHAAACYWLPRYKEETALKYRFGWKCSSMIHYYTEFLGMKDTICEMDLVLDGEQASGEGALAGARRENEILKEDLAAMRSQLSELRAVVKELVYKAA